MDGKSAGGRVPDARTARPPDQMGRYLLARLEALRIIHIPIVTARFRVPDSSPAWPHENDRDIAMNCRPSSLTNCRPVNSNGAQTERSESSLEVRSACAVCGDSEWPAATSESFLTVQNLAKNARRNQTPGGAPRRLPLTRQLQTRSDRSSSPSRTRTYNKPVNSRLLYH